MMKNVRIQNDFLALINDLVKVLKEDVSKIKTHEKDYSFLEKYSRSNMFEFVDYSTRMYDIHNANND